MSSVSIVIPALNDVAALEQALESCLSQENVVVHEVVIAIGPSTDGTIDLAAALAAKHPVVQLVDNASGRTPIGLNLAIRATTCPVVVRVDARSVLPPDYIANALETMQATGAANVGAIQHAVGKNPVQRSIAAAMRSRFGSGGAAYRGTRQLQRVDTAYLGVFRREALEDVGGFDESFIRNQDAELNVRLNRAGHEVWVDPRLVVDYEPRSSLKTLANQYWQYGWWRRKTVHKHPGSLSLRQVAAPVLLLCLLASTIIALWFPYSLLVSAAYVACVLGVGLSTNDLSLAERLVMAAALVVMHCSWAAGFLASSAKLLQPGS